MPSCLTRRLRGAAHAGILAIGLSFSVETATGQDMPDCGTETVDAWVNPNWHESLGASKSEEIAVERIVVVPVATRPAAIEALASTDIVALNDQQLDSLFPDGRPSGEGWDKLKPYLVRGVLANENGLFYGHMRGELLWIENHTLGCYRMSKAPVVVFTDQEPKFLQVGVGADF